MPKRYEQQLFNIKDQVDLRVQNRFDIFKKYSISKLFLLVQPHGLIGG